MRTFRSHGSQLTAIAVRPLTNFHVWEGPPPDPALVNTNPPVGEVPPPMPVDVQPKYEPMDTQPIEPPPQMPPAPAPALGQDEDAKSDTSFDPLFDDEPEADGDGGQGTSAQAGGAANGGGGIAYPSHVQMPQQKTVAAAIAPKNAPPVLDPLSYSTYSPDVLMVASIDGQIVLWDKRVHTPGRGVGRLWMSDKTPPWCVSVSCSR